MKYFAPDRGLRVLGLLVTLAGFAYSLAAQAQTSSPTLGSLMYFNGSRPAGAVTLGTDGLLYGVSSGSTFGSGATTGLIYRLATDASTVQTLYQYGRLGVYTGVAPQASLTADSSSNLYGVTSFTSAVVDPVFGEQPIGNGTIFKITTGGVYTKLYTFSDYTTTALTNADGAHPASALLLANDGFLYGSAKFGGANGTGALFKIATDGTGFMVLHSFAAGTGDNPDSSVDTPRPITADGAYPDTRLTQGTNGDLFGTTSSGGTNGTGVIFTLRRDGTGFTVMHSFDASPPTITDPADPNFGVPKTNGSGAYPGSGLLLASNGFLYGTTPSLGASGFGTIYRIAQNGSSPFTVLKAFDNAANGRSPYGDLIMALDGTIVGTTSGGGTLPDTTIGAGTLFSMSLDLVPTFATLYTFGADGGAPTAGVVQASDGALYGTTTVGGPYGLGTVYKFGAPTNRPPQGTPVPFDDGGAIEWWLVAALAMLGFSRTMRKSS